MAQKSTTSSEALAEAAIRGMQEVKGQDIKSIDLRSLPNSVSDFFVLCHGTSDIHVEALARAVEEAVSDEIHEKPMHREGTDSSEWVLLDYFNVVVHIFKEETRKFYDLETLWADGKVKEIAYQL